jgi:hypothetical protein
MWRSCPSRLGARRAWSVAGPVAQSVPPRIATPAAPPRARNLRREYARCRCGRMSSGMTRCLLLEVGRDRWYDAAVAGASCDAGQAVRLQVQPAAAPDGTRVRWTEIGSQSRFDFNPVDLWCIGLRAERGGEPWWTPLLFVVASVYFSLNEATRVELSCVVMVTR